ncbi:N-acetylneuraminate synthase [Bacillus thermophilus]|uniref:N-acetylneuraminate synthase n=1 Tax=Siminovitchia thermophila TaxID=1245522 RepID=A0ABS2R3K2_9BACI|nr:N-acetylneuraminate synthase family protein [Siminovitchia thermophila]MBM7714197.1 N-acetylneuraminate synthase [Siminovitchia thermophila]ONK23386.1 polyhydroxyalkanoate biosynthesis repressor PhaR [Bacillus sp. VT-16-64]
MFNVIRIASRKVGPEFPPLVIPEIGINHEGDLNKAIKMIDDAYDAGAEIVKFQSHVIEDEMIPAARQVIPGNAKESIFDIMSRCALSFEEEKELKNYVENKKMIFLSTPFSRAAADRLESIGVDAYKIGSGECNNYPLIDHVASFGKPMILSTGMNDIESISKAVEILERKRVPYALLHCVSMYPTPYEKVQLGAIRDLQINFPNAVLGLSDHSIGNYTCFGAVSCGASILEKHFTSDKTWPGPDIPISIDPSELKELMKGTEAIWQAMGGKKEIMPEEQATINFAYACVVSIKPIRKGERLTKDNIWVKRPGTGEMKAVDFHQVMGKTAATDIPADVQLAWNMVK